MAVSDVNGRQSANQPVARLQTTVLVASTGTNAETDVQINGLSKQFQFTVPDLDNTDTAEFKIQDEDNHTLYASGEKAESTTHVLNVERALCETMTLRVECSGPQAAARTFTVTIYYV